MLKIAGIAVVLMGLVTPVQAQQGASGMISETLLGPSNFSGGLNFSAALGGGYASPSQFSFSPDPNLRQSVTRNVLSDIARNDRGLAGALGSDPFKSFGPALAAHNISDSQIDDALAFMMIALWDAANASSAETTSGQAEGVKRQARSLLAGMGGRPLAGSTQEASDQLYLSALMISILASKVLDQLWGRLCPDEPDRCGADASLKPNRRDRDNQIQIDLGMTSYFNTELPRLGDNRAYSSERAGPCFKN